MKRILLNYLEDLGHISGGRTLVGVNTSQTEFNTVEKTGGDLTHKHVTGDHTLTVDEMPSHNHTFNDGLKLIVPKADGPYAVTDYILKTGQQLQVNNTGGSQAHNHGDTGSNSNLQPYITVYMWKRVS